jgi:hypothetical protein
VCAVSLLNRMATGCVMCELDKDKLAKVGALAGSHSAIQGVEHARYIL